MIPFAATPPPANQCSQVPFFIVALFAWLHSHSYIRIPAIIYGAHTATTLVPILAEILALKGLTPAAHASLVGIYAPYLIMPLLILWRAASRSDLFPKTKPAVKGQ